jgi:hypothetical protein
MLKRIAPAASLLAVLAFAGAAVAGNGAGPNKSSSSSISAPVVVSTIAAPVGAATSAPQYHDVITFNVSTTATTSPFVNLRCYQNGAQVGEGWATFFTGGTPGTFGLYSNSWTGGAADCTADLGMFTSNSKWKVLASTSFHVNP